MAKTIRLGHGGTTFTNVREHERESQDASKLSYFAFERFIADLEKETPYLQCRDTDIGISATHDVNSYQIYFSMMRMYTYCPCVFFECFNQLAYLDVTKFQKLLGMIGQQTAPV
jgi:hypothetical protein